ncbi:hypothetical protein B0H14DRAFT_3490651 [Mycena olivaceomarginata]|nr:hypothetical protein B0H14DRAFT_3490651 [Mycena olivaceomarginata]
MHQWHCRRLFPSARRLLWIRRLLQYQLPASSCCHFDVGHRPVRVSTAATAPLPLTSRRYLARPPQQRSVRGLPWAPLSASKHTARRGEDPYLVNIPTTPPAVSPTNKDVYSLATLIKSGIVSAPPAPFVALQPPDRLPSQRLETIGGIPCCRRLPLHRLSAALVYAAAASLLSVFSFAGFLVPDEALTYFVSFSTPPPRKYACPSMSTRAPQVASAIENVVSQPALRDQTTSYQPPPPSINCLRVAFSGPQPPPRRPQPPSCRPLSRLWVASGTSPGHHFGPPVAASTTPVLV